jgi:hypothetical protein
MPKNDVLGPADVWSLWSLRMALSGVEHHDRAAFSTTSFDRFRAIQMRITSTTMQRISSMASYAIQTATTRYHTLITRYRRLINVSAPSIMQSKPAR